MKLHILAVGRTADAALARLIDDYVQRARRYVPVQLQVVEARGVQQPAQQMEREGQLLLAALRPADHVVLLDERGPQPTSAELAQLLSRHMQRGCQRLVFVLGGAYGFSPEVRRRAAEQLSLSRLTLPHQLARLLLAEQCYRALTILHHHPYHHA